MKICLAFILPFIIPFLYLITRLCTYLLNKYNIFKCNNIIFQYMLCMFLSCANDINFISKNISHDQYYKDISSNIKIEGWFVDYFGMKVLICLLYFRLLDFRTKDNVYFQTSINELFPTSNIYTSYFMNFVYIFIMFHCCPSLIILETLYYLYKINKEYNPLREVEKYIYTNNIKYFYICVYSIILIVEFMSWIQLVIKWNNNLCLDGFYDLSTHTSYYIIMTMIYIYLFQISLFSELTINKYLMIFLILLSFSNATLATCIYMIYFEIYKTKMSI